MPSVIHQKCIQFVTLNRNTGESFTTRLHQCNRTMRIRTTFSKNTKSVIAELLRSYRKNRSDTAMS